MAINNYKQTDPRWNTIDYAGENINNAGCAPSMNANTSDNDTPATAAAWLTAHGYASNGYGTYWEGPPAFWKAIGKNGKQLNFNNLYGNTTSNVFTTFKNHIKSGYCGGLLMGPGYWTRSGHYISVVKYDSNTDRYLVHDPANPARDGWHPWADFEGVIKVCYTCSERWGEPVPIPFNVVGTATCVENNVNLRDFPDGNIVGHLNSGDVVEVDGETTDLRDWTHVRYNGLVGWVATHYLKSFVDSDFVEFEFHNVYSGSKDILSNKIAQAVLKSMNIYDGDIDGDIGRLSTAAIKKFQHLRSQTEDGHAGPMTKAALTNLVNDGRHSYKVRRLKGRAEGDSVVFLQRLLMVKGFYSGAIDGDKGPKTDDAIKEFQKTYGLKQDTDVYTETWKKVFETL